MNWLISCIAGFLVSIILHAFIRRFRPSLKPVLAFAIASSVCGVAFFVHMHTSMREDWVSEIAGCVTYTFLAELYVFVFTFVASSVSVFLIISRIGAPLAPSDRSSDRGSSMVETRIQMLASAGFIKKTGDKIRLTFGGRMLLRVRDLLADFFCHDDIPTTGQNSNEP